MDALNMKFLSDSQIDKIVTDPPWGIYDNIENLDIFYSKMLIEFHRVVRDKGIIVLLVSNRDIFTNVLEKHKSFFDIDKKYTTLVSGQKAIVYKLINKKKNK
jgi:tRNA G10  N-methylase Trm11